MYQNLFAIVISEITELNVAKDLIANEVNSIQENSHLVKGSDASGAIQQQAQMEPEGQAQGVLRPPEI